MRRCGKDGRVCLHAWLQTANAGTYKDRSHVINGQQGKGEGNVVWTGGGAFTPGCKQQMLAHTKTEVTY